MLEAAPGAGETAGSRDFAYERLVDLNARLRSYGLPDWKGTVVPEHHGPPLGAEQGCTLCHDGTVRGILTVSTSTEQIERKIGRRSRAGCSKPRVDERPHTPEPPAGPPVLRSPRRTAGTR